MNKVKFLLAFYKYVNTFFTFDRNALKKPEGLIISSQKGKYLFHYFNGKT